MDMSSLSSEVLSFLFYLHIDVIVTTDSKVFIVVTDRQFAVARLVGSPLNIKACLQYVFC